MSNSTSSNPYGPSPSRREVKQIQRALCSGSFCRKCFAKEGIKQCSKVCIRAIVTIFLTNLSVQNNLLLTRGALSVQNGWDIYSHFSSVKRRTGEIMNWLLNIDRGLLGRSISNAVLHKQKTTQTWRNYVKFLWQTFFSDATLIEVLIILKLELHQKPDMEQPFRAQIIIGFEPGASIWVYPVHPWIWRKNHGYLYGYANTERKYGHRKAGEWAWDSRRLWSWNNCQETALGMDMHRVRTCTLHSILLPWD